MTAIVVGYVDKPEGRAAVRRAVDEARLRRARLIIVNARRGSGPEAALPAVVDGLAGEGVEYELRDPAEDLEPAEDLIAVAERSFADMIVIGLRRRTTVGKLILGSNAQRILLDASCPVLAVKADQDG